MKFCPGGPVKRLSRLVCLVLWLGVTGTRAQVTLHTQDLPRFYQAFDSVLTTSDTLRQTAFIQQLYVDKASVGLKQFMALRGGNTAAWRAIMVTQQAILREKRPLILSVQQQEDLIRQKLKVFKSLYPSFREGDVYFCVGINNSGGTIDDRTVYIGTEVAAHNSPTWALPLVLHEYVHTQQWMHRNKSRILKSDSLVNQYLSTHKSVLGRCLEEGMADFVSELVYGKRLDQVNPDGYTAFGLNHEKAVWEAFKTDMFADFKHEMGWLYAKKEIDGQPMNDLGYFVGHQICKAYYDKARNKKQALNYMIGLDLTDENARRFLAESGYDGPKR
ncbi:hypothetical protein FAES_3670 [Fibrella aestuarina BUZ 2]|uniref:DUF2268 domain-containing protein n=1 Tax=Fibrella aestuarina BUZ 2 TaxID=1166018 RepID=I0KC24_9BACT|nr:hypothetical protein [Fibrella aestuarina]CCH01677.1 hypothetical protein FAES_3670 [Fibrella aestuarina BUZ 2]